MKRRLARWGLLFVVAVLLGTAVGGLLSHTLLYKYASLPFRWLVLASPVVGVLLYWWVDSLEELLGTMSVLIVVAGITTLLAYATPLFLLPSPTVAEQNVLLLDALNRTFMHLGLAAVLVVLGVLVAAVGYRERLVPDRWHEVRGRPNATRRERWSPTLRLRELTGSWLHTRPRRMPTSSARQSPVISQFSSALHSPDSSSLG